MDEVLDARLRHAADIVRGEDGGLVDHVVMIFTKEDDDGESYLALRTTGNMPRWVLKGLLIDTLDMIDDEE